MSLSLRLLDPRGGQSCALNDPGRPTGSASPPARAAAPGGLTGKGGHLPPVLALAEATLPHGLAHPALPAQMKVSSGGSQTPSPGGPRCRGVAGREAAPEASRSPGQASPSLGLPPPGSPGPLQGWPPLGLPPPGPALGEVGSALQGQGPEGEPAPSAGGRFRQGCSLEGQPEAWGSCPHWPLVGRASHSGASCTETLSLLWWWPDPVPGLWAQLRADPTPEATTPTPGSGQLFL